MIQSGAISGHLFGRFTHKRLHIKTFQKFNPLSNVAKIKPCIIGYKAWKRLKNEKFPLYSVYSEAYCSSHPDTVSSLTRLNTYLPMKASGAQCGENTEP